MPTFREKSVLHIVPDIDTSEALTKRQKAVLDAALRLLVEEGDQLTMTAVARRASCSKETLYKWFGDRDGLLTATVQWQASKVRVAPVDRKGLDLASLTASLERFASDWLKVISSDTSIALNRVAVSHAGSGKDNLGAVVLENGRFALAKRLKPVLEAGRRTGLLDFADAETAFRTFFGLVARDVQIRLLLGDRLELTEAAIGGDAARATQQFLALHGATTGRKALEPDDFRSSRPEI
ncbi:TetR/AcrR family transcriptional regulator [Mesorhizobium ciceri]|uniref:TetR/AcrR family transcriptional regulator n=1 Tax=Mesorhizobium ciceri TaxID=39645 RepID=UPI001FCDA80C|nr:TetR/AcrR family transcriptional regulator [Mesorhizobium ciceri]